jgi:phosphate:Na+ symporter
MIKHILLFSTGVILFLFAMIRLSETVQQRFTNIRIREYFRLSVKTPVYGIITGLISTILFQSSSATSVLTVGLVSAGLISFFNSLGIILGADIGTTLTVQLVVWKFTDISPIFIIIGSLVWITGKGQWKYVGMSVFYFGLIFFGLSLVSLSTAPLKNNEAFIHFFQQVKNPFIGVFIGLAVTALIQSSAIPISVLAILAHHNMVTIDSSLPIVFGANLGTAVTALLAGLAANINGKRTAVSHFLLKLFGVVICLFILSPFLSVLKSATTNVPQQIALGHFLFNLVIVILFTPFLKPFSEMIEKIMPGKAEVFSLWPEYLDEKKVSQPDVALDCARKEIERQLSIVQKMFSKSIELISNYRESERNNVQYIEFVVDTLRREIGNYLCDISRQLLSPSLSKTLFAYSQMTDVIERIGDHALTIAQLSERKYRRKITFTDIAYSDIRELEMLVNNNLEDAATLVAYGGKKMTERIYEREDHVDIVEKDLRERHLERFYKGICSAEAGPIFIDMLIHLERISDHCENIAECMEDLDEE